MCAVISPSELFLTSVGSRINRFFTLSPPLHQLALVSPNGEQYDSLLRQLRDRMEEGSGETIYVVGMGSGKKRARTHTVTGRVSVLLLRTDLVSVSLVDGGDWGLDEKDMEASVATVCSMCEQLDTDLILLRERNESAGLVRDYLIRRRVGELDFLEVR